MPQLGLQTSDKSFTPKRTLRSIFVVLAVLAAISMVAIAMPPIERQLDKWGLLPRHEQMTELYIPDPTNLSTTYNAGEEHTIRFELCNLEGEARSYDYTVTARKEHSGAVMQLDQGNVAVRNGETKSLELSTVLHDLGKRVYIQIELSNGQKVGYWLEQER